MQAKAICAVSGLLGCLVPTLGYAADPASDTDEANPSHISYSLDLVYATRAPTIGVVIVDTGTGDPVLAGDDLAFGWAPGVDARLSVETGDMDVDFRFLGGFGFSATTAVVTPAIWNFPTNPQLFGLGVADVAADYDSSLNALEFNLSKPLGAGIVFAGVRGLMLNENLVNDADFGAITASVRFGAATLGVGPQIGGRMRFGGDAFVEIDGRAAALLTKSTVTMDVSQSGGPSLFAASGDPWNWAAVVEAGATAGIAVGPQAALRLGYRAIYVHNVPTAVSTVGAADPLNGSVAHSGDAVFVHGVTLGFEGHF